jgi:hypothetical protein
MNNDNDKRPPLKLITISASFDIKAAAADKPDEPATFDFLAYSGGALRLMFYSLPVVIDLQGIKYAEDQNISILVDHMRYPSAVAGNTTKIVNDGKVLRESGILYNTIDNEIKKIVAKARLGHKWQCSVGALPLKIEYVPEDTKITVNAQEFKGPIYIARESELLETSIVVIGADRDNEVDINAMLKEAKNRKPLTIITT